MSIINFLICGGGLLSFILFAIYPNQMSLSKMEKKIRRLMVRIEEQKMLFPLFQELIKIGQEKNQETLPFPEKEKLSRNGIGSISSTIQEISRNSNLSLEGIAPDVNSLVEASGHLRMNLNMKGKFADLRNFLMRLGEIPYLEHIEQIQIRTLQESEEFAFSLKIWMAQEEK